MGVVMFLELEIHHKPFYSLEIGTTQLREASRILWRALQVTAMLCQNVRVEVSSGRNSQVILSPSIM